MTTQNRYKLFDERTVKERLLFPEPPEWQAEPLNPDPGREEFFDALDLLFEHARGDHGGGRRSALFLLSLWNSFNFHVGLVEVFGVDSHLYRAMITVLLYLRARGLMLGSVVTQQGMDPVLKRWGDDFRVKTQS